MSKMLRTAGMVVAAVALVATTAGLAAPAVVGAGGAVVSAGGIAGVSAATLGAIGTYGGLAAAALTSIAAATAPGVSAQGSASKFTTNPQSGLPYAMGRTRMSGLRFFAATNTRPGYTKFNDLLWFGALLSIGGPIEGIEKFTADGEVVSFDTSGNAIGDFRDYMAQKVHLGGPMSTALNLSLGGGTAPGWTSAHKLSGITHAMWCLRYNKQGEMYGAGAPEPAWIGKWVKVYDPRLDSTYPGGSGSCRALDESTYVWSDNPGLHALTWALGRWQNGERTCGIGAPVETIRMAEFVECANVCEANGWKVGGVEWTTDSKWDTLKRILQAGGAKPTQTAAMIGCLVNTPRTAIATIESRHLLDGLSLAATKSRRERISSVIPRYVDEDSDWSVISGTAITVSEYATADKGKRTKEIDFPLVQVFSGEEAKQPGQLAAYEIVNSREAGPWAFTTGPEWIGLKTGDVVYLHVPEEGLVNQPVMITRRAIDPSTGKVSFAVETETYAKHAFALGETTTPPAPWSPVAPDLKPPAPVETEWSVSGTTSGEGFPALLVAGDSEMPSADAIVIDYRLHSENETATDGWTNSAILSAIDTVRHVIAPLESQTPYDVRVSYRVGTIDGDTTIFEQVVTGVGKITTIENHLEDQDEQLAQLDTDIAQATINIAAAQATIVQMQAVAAETKAELEADIASINATADQIQADAAATRASLATAQADIIAAGGRIDTIETTLGDQNASITSLAQTVSNHTGRLASIDTTLTANGASINQNAQAISAVQGDLASLSSTVSTQGASISQNAQAITAANQNIASLSSTVTAHGASISQNAQAISSLNSNLTTLTTRVAAAGTNLLPNGGLENGFNSGIQAIGGFVFSASPEWGAYAYTTVNGFHLFAFASLIGPQVGARYTFAIDALAYGSSDIACDMVCVDSNSNELATSNRTVMPGQYNFSNDDNRRAMSASTITVPNGTAQLVCRVLGTVRNGQIIGFRRAKLESGAQWSRYSAEASVVQQFQALSGLTGQYASLSTTVSTHDGSITTLQQSMSSAQGSISSLESRVTTINANVGQNASAISAVNQSVASLSSTVTSQGAAILTAQQAITNLNSSTAILTTVLTAGSNPNLVKNAGFETGNLQNWSAAGMTFGVGASGGWGMVAAGYSNIPDNSYAFLDSEAFPVFGNAWYTATADSVLRVTGGSAWCNVQLLFFDGNGNLVGNPQSQFRNADHDFTSDGSSRKVLLASGVTPASAVSAKIRLAAYKVTGVLTVVGWRLAKVEQGQIATAFSSEASVTQAFQALSTLNTQYASLSSTVSTQGVTVSQHSTAITTINNNVTTLFGRAALTVEVGGVITGWETNNNGATGDFKIRADRFQIVTAAGGTKTFEARQGTIIGYYSNGSKMYQLGEQSVA